MDNTVTSFPAPPKEADEESTLEGMFAEMRLLNEKMRNDQIEIDRIKEETQRIGEQTRVILARLGASV